MRLRSFRLRIALLSALLAGSALIGFGAVSWRLIYDAKVSRLDANLENQLRRSLRPRPQAHWQPFDAFLSRGLGISANTPIALLVIDANGNPLYRSDTWEAELGADFLSPSPQHSILPSPRRPALLPPDAKQFPLEGNRSAPPEEPPVRLDRIPAGPPPMPQIKTQRTTTGVWRVGVISSDQVYVAIAVSLQTIDQEVAVIFNVFLIAIPVVLLLIAAGAWSLSGSALRPIRHLTTAIQQVTVKGLDQRVPIAATDVELMELIQVFNQMLERLERSFKQASRFSGDAAHELKTPLTILQGELERSLQQAPPGSEMQQSLGHLLDEVRRLSGIVRKLLLLSLADAGQMGLHKVEVNVSAMLMEMVEDMELLAPQLQVHTQIATNLRVWGDRDLLTQILQNLFSNAIKYNLPQGWITIHAHQQADTTVVTISNASKDIPEHDRDRIFDRFHRGDPARTRKVEGTGLGLSLAREIARAHGGNLTLDATPSGQTAFTLRLPIATGQTPLIQ